MSERAMTMTGWVLTGLYALFMLGASVTPKLRWPRKPWRSSAGRRVM
ncbi:hypothetical protein [Mesorhizobium yinganensis]